MYICIYQLLCFVLVLLFLLNLISLNIRYKKFLVPRNILLLALNVILLSNPKNITAKAQIIDIIKTGKIKIEDVIVMKMKIKTYIVDITALIGWGIVCYYISISMNIYLDVYVRSTMYKNIIYSKRGEGGEEERVYYSEIIF